MNLFWYRISLWIMVLLLIMSVPWYRSDQSITYLMGLPDWVFVSLACYLLIALINGLMWLTNQPKDDKPS